MIKWGDLGEESNMRDLCPPILATTHFEAWKLNL